LTKRSLQRRILASDVPDDAFLEGYLRAYFPEALNARCGQQIRSHRLRREIIAAELARMIVESMGVTFVGRVCRETGAEAAAVIRAWAVVVETSGALQLWDEVGNAEPPLPMGVSARVLRHQRFDAGGRTFGLVEGATNDENESAGHAQEDAHR
jgi:glutamate dehydrogenase